ncbi:O-antigen ligase family protein [Sanguibacter sp. 25GB23B1]|uniref:O-antigen ligase family protein n=1 Tax=unclassified Sanguibacter TaxID=2645534 RepID=UPI0032AF09B1
MDPKIVLLVVGAVAVMCVVLTMGRFRFAVAALFAALTFLPVRLLGFGDVPLGWTVGVSSAVPALTTYNVLLLGFALVLLVERKLPRAARYALPVVVFCGFGALVLWPTSPNVTSGLLHVLACACAWAVGLHLGARLDPDGPSGRFVALVLLLVACVLGLSVASQLASGAGEVERASGLFAHPATLGKLGVIFLGLLLPLSRSAVGRTRVMSYAAVVVLFAMTAPTLSRANILAMVVVILAWALLLPAARNLGKKILLPLATAAVFVPVLDNLLTRFAVDSEGGDRPELLAAGYRQIAAHPWTGTGPNNYVTAVGGHEPIVALTGYPVHNTFLLTAAELGIVGAALFFLPLAYALGVALRHLRVTGHAGDAARGILVLLLGVTVVGITGWAVVQQPVAEALFLVGGILLAQVQRARPATGPTPAAASTATHAPRPVRRGARP